MRHKLTTSLSKLLLLFFAFFELESTHGQIPSLNPFFNQDSTYSIAPNSDVTIPKISSLGKHFADPNWYAGNILLTDKRQLNGYYMRYDLVRNQLEIITGTDIRVLKYNRIKTFNWFNTSKLKQTRFINCAEFQFDGNSPLGVFEILVDGESMLLKHAVIQPKRGTTSPTLVHDTGGADTERFETYYVAINGKAYLLEGSRKQKLAMFQNFPILLQRVRRQNLVLNNEKHLIQIVEYSNSLSKDQASW